MCKTQFEKLHVYKEMICICVYNILLLQMSIVTLKRKTEARYNNMSVGQKHFSINGTARNQGYIGQTSLSRTFIHTPYKGPTAKGNGGCCGKYDSSTDIPASEICCLEDNTVVKSSVLSTRGMLATKHRWITRPYPHTSTKPDYNRNINDQGDYVTRLVKKTVTNIQKIDEDGNILCPQVLPKTQAKCTTPMRNTSGAPLFSKSTMNKCPKDLTPVDKHKFISQSERVIALHDKCAEQDVVYIENTAIRNTPFAC
jgi:hypothetical protein